MPFIQPLQDIKINTGRNLSFDFLKLLAIFLVLYGHCEQHLIDIDKSENSVYTLIYTFHMPLFMMISGYFASLLMKLSFRELIYKKARALLMPVLTFSTVITCYYYFIQYRFQIDGVAFLTLWLEQLNTWLWFLKSLFFCFVIYYLADKLHPVVTASVIIAFMGVTWHNIGFLLPCFAAGLYIRRHNILQKVKSNGTQLICSTLVFYLLLLCFYSNWFKQMPSNCDMLGVLLLYFKQLYRIVLGVSGASAIMFIAYKLLVDYKGGELYEGLCYCGKYTLEIYVLQCFILEMMLPMFLHIPASYAIICHTLVFPLLSLVLLLLCVALAKLIGKIKIANLLFFGK